MCSAGSPAEPIFVIASSLDSDITIGLVSVIPNACCRWRPFSAHTLISSSGVGDPPTPTDTSVGNVASANAGTWLMNSQFAGTPRKWVMPISGSVSTRTDSSGTK